MHHSPYAFQIAGQLGHGFHGRFMFGGRAYRFSAEPEHAPHVGGVFSSIGHAFSSATHAVAHVVSTAVHTPLVRSAIQLIPGGGAALTAEDALEAGVALAKGAMASDPHHAQIALGIAHADPQAVAHYHALPPATKVHVDSHVHLLRDYSLLVHALDTARRGPAPQVTPARIAEWYALVAARY